MHRTLALLVVAAAVRAQTPASGQQKTGSILGVVRDGVGGATLGGVRIYGPGGVAVTDAQGRFAFDNATPGLLRVQAADTARGASGGAYVLVEAGQTATTEISLKLGGTISGKVLDEDRKSVEGAMVVLLGKRYEFGEVAYTPGKPVVTGRNGEYRIEGVPAERSFVLLAKKTLKLTEPAEDPPEDVSKRERVLLPAFYPTAPDIGGAQPLMLGPGERREGVDIRMASAPSYCIQGKVEGVGDGRQPPVSVTERFAADSSWRLAPATAPTAKDSDFRACGLHPGEYRLSAISGDPVRNIFATVEAVMDVTVAGGDVRDVMLTGGGVTFVPAAVTFDPPRPGQTRIVVSLTNHVRGDGYADSAEPTPSGRISGNPGAMNTWVYAPSEFRLPAFHGEWEVRVSEMPAGCYLKKASYGEQDLRRTLLRVDQGKAGRIEIVIGCDGGGLVAKVVDRDGNPVSHVSLYLMAAEADSAAAMAMSLRRTEVSQGVSAPLSGLAPGKYLALATDFDLSQDASADEMDKLWAARSRAQEVQIGPGATVHVTLTPQTIN